MVKVFRNWKFWLLILAVIIAISSVYFYHRANRYKVLDRTAFSDLISETSAAAEEGFESQEQLSSFITDWADKNGMAYDIDKAGNIIFDTPAIDRKKNVSPTVVICGLNYKTASEKSILIASAASIAAADLESGRKIVIFVNDENNNGKGYKALSKKYVSEKTKVVYLDQGNKAYLSPYSFAETISEISIPAKKEDATLDTAVKISISGIDTREVTPQNSLTQPDPLSVLGSLLTRLKSKSVVYNVSDFRVGSNENMYPDSVEVCIMLNSYSLDSFTKFIDHKVKEWTKDYAKDNPNLSFTYEVISNEESLPKKCYDTETSDQLTRLLYTIGGNVYTFSKSDSIPETKSEGDYCGVNAVMNLTAEDSSIKLKLLSQGYDELFLNRIVIDNRAGAELLGCGFKETEIHEAFENDEDSLFRTFKTTYSKVHSSSESSELAVTSDSFFTPCSYLAEKNSNSDIVHLRLSKKSAANLVNTLMCYIKTKGNTFSL